MHVIEELVLFYNYIYSGDYLALVTLAVKPYFRDKTQRVGVKLFSKKSKKSKVSKISINKINKLLTNIKNSQNTQKNNNIFNKIMNNQTLNNVPVKHNTNNTNNNNNNNNNNNKSLKDIKNIHKLVTGGIKSYDKLFNLGLAIDLLDRNIMTKKILDFLQGLDKDKNYSVLLVGSI